MRRFLILIALLAAPALAQQQAVALRLTLASVRSVRRTTPARSPSPRAKSHRVLPWRFGERDSIDGSGWRLQLLERPFENQPSDPRHMAADPRPSTSRPPASPPPSRRPPHRNYHRQNRARRLLLLAPRRRAGSHLALPRRRRPRPAHALERANELSDAEHYDYPAVAESSNGVVWMTWQGYAAQGDHVYARRKTASGWSQTWKLTDSKTDVLRTAVAVDGQGRVFAVWSERDGQQWHLYARTFANNSWGARQKITDGHYPNIFHRLTPTARAA
ncbi:MAG: hypothetical protein R2724_07110 [Bryobacterales bacterium]